VDAELTIPFDFADIRLLQELIEAAIRASPVTSGDIFLTKLSVEEALVNALKHGTSIRPALEIAVDAVRRGGRTD
jgi:anti-sigma regulatory factor (Ser/Thr protein kinase)